MILSDIDSLGSASAQAVKNDAAPTEFVGSYRMASGDEVKVAYADNTFTFTTAKGFTTALHRVASDHFAGFTGEVRFVRNDAGQVTEVKAMLPDGTGITAQRAAQ
ncbi:MAG: hypothetical protein IPL77_07080 [Flavobacteriales bacterium]|nr:hypothetical protein [Flavobacteriales bacterium]